MAVCVCVQLVYILKEASIYTLSNPIALRLFPVKLFISPFAGKKNQNVHYILLCFVSYEHTVIRYIQLLHVP